MQQFTAVVTPREEGGVDVKCAKFDPATKAGEECAQVPATTHSPILPETNELIYSIISFAVLALLFMKFAYPMVKKTMEGRTDKIRTDLDTAESAKTEAETVLSQYRAQLADAKSESNRIIEEARSQAERVKNDMIAATQAEVNELKAKAATDVETARTQAMASLRSSVSDMAIEIAEKVVERNLDRETNLRLVDSFINQVGG
jgi:F-type H+-transporting ATPase subunit b